MRALDKIARYMMRSHTENLSQAAANSALEKAKADITGIKRVRSADSNLSDEQHF
jgi:hypothetical protein